MIFYYILLLLMTIFSAFAGFFIKKSTNSNTILKIIGSKYLYIGGFLYLIAALFNIWLLKKMSYSIVVPLGGICYIWTMFISRFFLKEKIGVGKVIGILLIVSGVICIAV